MKTKSTAPVSCPLGDLLRVPLALLLLVVIAVVGMATWGVLKALEETNPTSLVIGLLVTANVLVGLLAFHWWRRWYDLELWVLADMVTGGTTCSTVHNTGGDQADCRTLR